MRLHKENMSNIYNINQQTVIKRKRIQLIRTKFTDYYQL